MHVLIGPKYSWKGADNERIEWFFDGGIESLNKPVENKKIEESKLWIKNLFEEINEGPSW